VLPSYSICQEKERERRDRNRLIEELTQAPLITLAIFFVAAIAEIGGGYLVWLWLREKKTIALGALGGIILFVYGIIPTLQPAEFGRVYAAYGGIFIVSAIIWGRIVDKKKPDRYEVIGSIVAVIGAIVIFYAPR
jgi:small multidrug resistance family-3 protein